MASRYWVASSTGNWNDTANWSTTSGGAGGQTVPTSSDDVTFDSGGVGNCTINASVSVNSWNIASTYTGQITNAANNTYTVVGNFTWAAAAGSVFQAGTGTHSVGGNVTFSAAGTTSQFAGSTSTWNISGNWTSTALSTSNTNFDVDFMTVNFLGTSKTIASWNITSHMIGTVNIGDGTNVASLSVPVSGTTFRGFQAKTLTVKNNATFTVAETGSSGGCYAETITVDSGGTFTGGGNISIFVIGTGFAFTNNGTFSCNGVISIRGNGTISNPQPFSGTWSFLKYGNSNRTVTLGGTLFHIQGSVTVDNELSSGTYTWLNNATTLRIDGDFTTQHTGGGTSTMTITNNGTIQLGGSNPGTQTITLLNRNYGHLTIDASGTKTFASSRPFTTGNLTLTNGTANFNGNTITVGGNFTASSGSSITAAGLAGATLDISGNATFTGTNGSHKTLNPSSAWTLIVDGTGSMSYCDVKNCDASGGSQIDASDSTNSDEGSNTNFLWPSIVIEIADVAPRFKPAFCRLNFGHPLARGLIVELPLWEPGGNVQQTSLPIPTLSGSGNVTHIASSIGSAVSTTAFSTGYHSSLDVAGPITFAALVRFTGNQTTNASPYRRAITNAAGNSLWGFESLGATSVSAVARTSGGTRLATTNYAYTANRWHHLLGVADPAGTLSIYVDGQLIEAKAVGSFTFASSTFGIVALNGVSDVAFAGQLAGCWAWNRALSADAIAAHARDPFAFYRH